MAGEIDGARSHRSARGQSGCLDCSGLRNRQGVALIAALMVAIAGVFAIAGCGPTAAPPVLDRKTGAEQAAPVPSMAGLLIDVHGGPVAGASIEVRAAGETEILGSDVSDAAGSFDFDVTPGIYDVRVIPGDGSPPQTFPGQVIGFNGGGTLELMQVAIAAETTAVSLRIVDPRGGPMPGTVCSHGGCAPIGVDGSVQVTVGAGFPPVALLSSQIGYTSLSVQFLVEPGAAIDGVLPDLVIPLLQLNGQVVDSTGNPLATFLTNPGCYPVDYPGLTGFACLPSTVTGADGSFQFPALPGLAPMFVGGPTGTFQNIDVTTADVTLKMPSPHQLSGQITNRDGNPIAGVTICLKHAGCSSKACLLGVCVGSDQSGRYQTELSEGDYEMDLTFANLTLSTQVTLAATRELNIVLPNRRLTGQLLDGSGSPEVSVPVSAACYPVAFDGFAGNFCPGTQPSDQDGRFQFDLAAPGSVRLTASNATGSAGLTVAVADDTDVSLQMTTVPEPIMGRLVDQNGQGIGAQSVCYTGDPGASIGGCSLTDPTGAYQFALLPGNYQVFASTTDSNGISHADFYGPVTVRSPAVTLTSFQTRRLAVQLVGGDGAPIANASVNFAGSDIPVLPNGYESASDFNARVTDANGGALLGAIPGAPLMLNIGLPGAIIPGGFIVRGSAPDDLQSLTIALQAR